MSCEQAGVTVVVGQYEV